MRPLISNKVLKNQYASILSNCPRLIKEDLWTFTFKCDYAQDAAKVPFRKRWEWQSCRIYTWRTSHPLRTDKQHSKTRTYERKLTTRRKPKLFVSTVQSNAQSDFCSIMSNIENFYAGKSVLVTGATGFVGKVFVEKLLRSCTLINKVYIIIRTKRNGENHTVPSFVTKTFFSRRNGPPAIQKIRGACRRLFWA